MKKFIKSSSTLMIGNIVTKMLSILYIIPLVRFNPEIGNLNTFLLVPFAFIIVFSTLGLDVILTSEIVKAMEKKDQLKNIVVSSFVILFITGLITALTMYFGAEFFIKYSVVRDYQYTDFLIKATKFLSIAMLLNTMICFFKAILVAMGEYGIVSISYVLEQVIKIIFLIALSYNYIYLKEFSVGVYVYILTIAIVISMFFTLGLYVYVFLKKKYYTLLLQGHYQTDKKIYKYLFISSFVFFAAGLFTPFFDQIDLFMLPGSLDSLGIDDLVVENILNEYFIYSAKFIMIPITTAAAFITVMIRYLHVNQEDEKKVLEFNHIINVSLIYGVVSMAILFVVGPFLVTIFYGVNSVGIMSLQSLLIPMYVIRNIIGSYIVTSDGSQKSIIFSMFLIMVLKYVLNLVFFALFGISGFIYSSMVTIIISIFVLVYMNKQLFIVNKKELLAKAKILLLGVVCLVIGFLLMVYIKSFVSSAFVNLVIGMVIQLILIIILFKNYIIKYNKK